jgi:hypothetical protein
VVEIGRKKLLGHVLREGEEPEESDQEDTEKDELVTSVEVSARRDWRRERRFRGEIWAIVDLSLRN